MTKDELRAILHTLGLDYEPEASLLYIFYETPDGMVHNFSISIDSARLPNRRPMTDEQLADLMLDYPDTRRGKIIAIERPTGELTHWMDVFDVCRRLSTSRQSLRRWVKRGWLHPSRLGRRLYFDPDEVEHLLRSNIIQPNGRIDKVAANLELSPTPLP